MSCERYKKALTQAAGAETPLPGAVRDHLDACPRCQAAFAGERALFAAIDSGLRATANAPVPPAFLQRSHARLAQETRAARVGSLHWLHVAAAATALIILMLPILRPRSAKQPAVGSSAPQDPPGRHLPGQQKAMGEQLWPTRTIAVNSIAPSPQRPANSLA